jgi:hypothetical protein
MKDSKEQQNHMLIKVQNISPSPAVSCFVLVFSAPHCLPIVNENVFQ